MKNILVPIDFSECSLNAAETAMSIAVRSKADIHFLHIMPEPAVRMHVPHSTTIPGGSAQEGHAQNELNILVARASRIGLMAKPLLVYDKGNERIENYITPLNIDLIVMGSHGASGIRELVIGSQTQRVVRHSSVPVLVIKNMIHDPYKIERIVFASTFQEDNVSAFDVVITFARLWKASVHILFINFIDKLVDDDAIKSIIQKLITNYPDISFTSNTAEANDEEWGIHQFIKMIDADMVAITTHDKTGFIVRHSVAEDLVNHEKVPVLVIGGGE